MFLLILLKVGNFSDQVVEKTKAHFLFNTFFSENRPVYQIIWKNTVKPDMPQMTISRVRFACCTPKATDTLSEYVIVIVFPREKNGHANPTECCVCALIACLFTFLKKCVSVKLHEARDCVYSI